MKAEVVFSSANNDKQNVTGDLLVFPKATYITVIRELLKTSISLV